MLLSIGRFQTPRTARLRGLLEPYAGRNVFNPSILQSGSTTYLAFRHLGPERRPPFEASILVNDDQRGTKSYYNLTHHVAGYGVKRVSDPKLLQLNGTEWVTFNDGWEMPRNRLYLMQVAPALGQPYECIYQHRQPVEKNWTFRIQDGMLWALYTLHPWRLLVADTPEHSAGQIVFRDIPVASATNMPCGADLSGLSIGTQAASSAGTLYLVAHEKLHISRFRAYLGRLVRLDTTGICVTAEVSRKRLCHSLPALLGARKRFNNNLLSCTYFSGLVVDGGAALLAYGVNDVDFGFAEVPLTLL